MRRFSTLVAFLLPVTAFAQIGTMTPYSNDSVGGVWWFNSANGRASYCQPVQTSGGNPTGKCVVIGTVGVSASGFSVQLASNILWVTSKTTGTIYQCSFVLINGVTPQGNCAPIANISSLQ